MTIAYLPVRSGPFVQPKLFENLIPGSDMNSYLLLVFNYLHTIFVNQHVKESPTHNVILLYPVRLAPRAHHPSIIHSNDNDQIHTFALDFI